MPSKYREEDLTKIKPISIASRTSKVQVESFIDPENLLTAQGVTGAAPPLNTFPDALAGGDLKELAARLQRIRQDNGELLWLTGAHVIKCGLSLVINSLLERGFITALAVTGSSAIHDLELAFFGETSEDVAAELPAGRFGMSGETAGHFNAACRLAAGNGLGLGEGIGRYIEENEAPSKNYSVFAAAYRNNVPVTVHIAFGTDIVHQHPDFPAAAAGELTMKDFRIVTATVGRIFNRGAVVVFGSAVVLPEVFLKAAAINYNLGRKPDDVTAAAFDMMSPYRVRENILTRPFQGCGRSYSFTGHHEIMLPLLYTVLNPRPQ